MERAGQRGYRHGNLRTALIDEALKLIGERGSTGFSVAEVARRIGVSAAAPYRHFKDRDELLAAAAIADIRQIGAEMQLAVESASEDPVECLAATAAAYVRHAVRNRTTFAFRRAISSPAIEEVRRDYIDILCWLIRATPAARERDMPELLECYWALTYGYARLFIDVGVFALDGSGEQLAQRAAHTCRLLFSQSEAVGPALVHAPRRVAAARR